MKNKIDLAKLLGSQIKHHRLRKKLTQEKLASALHIEANTISRFECGTHLPSLERLEQIAHILEVSMSTLLGNASSNHTDQSETLLNFLNGLTADQRNLIMEVAKRQAEFFKANSK